MNYESTHTGCSFTAHHFQTDDDHFKVIWQLNHQRKINTATTKAEKLIKNTLMSSINIIVRCYPAVMLLLQGETIKTKKKLTVKWRTSRRLRSLKQLLMCQSSCRPSHIHQVCLRFGFWWQDTWAVAANCDGFKCSAECTRKESFDSLGGKKTGSNIYFTSMHVKSHTGCNHKYMHVLTHRTFLCGVTPLHTQDHIS